ncbi:MAG: aspartate aminotransferase family protein [Dehalococcoidia bacterium]
MTVTRNEAQDPSRAADGETIEDYITRGLAHLWVHTQQYNELAKPDGFKVFVDGDGIWLTDMKGRRFIDCMSGLWVVNSGHGRQELADVAADQMKQLSYVSSFAYATRPAVDLASKLAEILPSTLNKVFFANSGSEAVETAIKIAKQYHWNRGERRLYKVIARRGSYHGVTAGALSVNSAAYTNRLPFEPLVPGTVPVDGVNCYRCAFEKSYPECDVFCARHVETVIKNERPETIAALIGEPISVANGNYVPPDGYWPALREICDRYGIVLIADEVINAFGRTGRWFATDHWDFEPDLMTMAKGLSSGYLPISAVAASDRIVEAFVGERGDALSGGITFGSHPVSCAVALANVNIIERERLVENAATVGTRINEHLREMAERHPSIGEVRGLGLLIAFETVKNRETKESFEEVDGWAEALSAGLFSRGVLVRGGNQVNIAPPLVMSAAEADDLMERVDAALGEAEAAVGLA